MGHGHLSIVAVNRFPLYARAGRLELATRYLVLFAALTAILFLHACTCGVSSDSTIKIDGSSTVYLITEAVAEEYQRIENGRVSIGLSGTGGGFKKLCSKRINIIGASRKISASEKKLCEENEVKFLELPVAYDGIVVVVNKNNVWLNEIKISQLKKIFAPEAEGKILKWSDIDTSWPARKFEIFAPGVSSGTYDYFTQVVVGKSHNSRGDITSSEDDNVLVHGVRTTKDAIGFFSFAYYIENKNELKALAIIDDSSNKPTVSIAPTPLTIRNGSYHPLSRQVFLYANHKLNSASKDFLNFYLRVSPNLLQDVGFITLSDEDHRHALEQLKDTL